MNSRSLFVLVFLGTMVLPFSAQAARKYYPPGFNPPSDEALKPVATPLALPPSPPKVEAPIVIIQAAPPPKPQVIIKMKPRDPLTVLMDERRYYDALRLVDTQLKKSPNNFTLQLNRAQLLREDAQYNEAADQFNAILMKAPGKNIKASAWNGLGWTWYQKAARDKKTGNKEALRVSASASENAFKTAVQLLPNLSNAWSGLGRLYLLSGRVKDAAWVIEKAGKLAPNSLAVQLAQADLLLAKHEPHDALQILYGLKKTTTVEPDVYFLLARASFDTDRVDDAIINLKQLLEMEPQHTEALTLLSQAYGLKMKPDDAKDTLETALTLNPADTKAAEALLKIYDRQEDGEHHSLLLLKNLLKTQPEQPLYIQALLSRLNQQGRWDESYQEGSRLIPGFLHARKADSPDNAMPSLAAFSRSVFQKGRGLLDRRALLHEPAVASTLSYTHSHWQRLIKAKTSPLSSAMLQDRFILLCLDPLLILPPLPVDSHPASVDLPLAIECAFLSGEAGTHAALIEQVKALSLQETEAAAQKANVVAALVKPETEIKSEEDVAKSITGKTAEATTPPAGTVSSPVEEAGSPKTEPVAVAPLPSEATQPETTTKVATEPSAPETPRKLEAPQKREPIQQAEPDKSPRLLIAQRLYDLGDFQGADELTRAMNSPDAFLLQEQIASARLEVQDHLTALSLLANKTSNPYWQKMAGDALRSSGGGDYKTHATLVKILEKKRLPELARYHLQMTIRYAPTTKDRVYWIRQANKKRFFGFALPTSS
jgi:predicted Zn-dependent protease